MSNSVKLTMLSLALSAALTGCLDADIDFSGPGPKSNGGSGSPSSWGIAAPAANAAVAATAAISGACRSGAEPVRLAGSGLSAPVDFSCLSNGTFSKLVAFSAGDGSKQVTLAQGASSASRSFVMDTTAPAVSVSSPAAGAVLQGTVTIAGSCEIGLIVTFSGSASPSPSTTSCAAGSYSQAVTLGGSDGSVALQASQIDGAGNNGFSSSVTLSKDTVPPAVVISAPSAGTVVGSAITITGTCETGLPVSFGGSGTSTPAATSCGSGSFVVNTAMTSGDGTKNITLSQTDAAGNTTTVNRDFLRDATAPTISIAAPANGSSVPGTITVSGSCEAGLTVTLGGGANPSPASTACSSGSFSQLVSLGAVDGSQTLTVSQTDAGSNVGGAGITVTKDSVSPAIAFSSPSAGTAMGGSVTITGTCEIGLTVTAGGTGTSSPTTVPCSSGTFLVNMSFTAGDGPKVITLSQTDAAGNTGSANRSFTRDTTAPAIAFSGPADGSTHQSGLTVSGSCETGLPVSLSGTSNPSPTSFACSSGAFSQFVILGSSDGSITLTVSQTDGVGNVGSTTRTVTKDTIAPTISVGAPSSGSSVGASVAVSGSCEAGLTVQFSGGSSPTPSSTSCSSGSYSELLTLGASDGAVTLNVGQTDAAGNPGLATVTLTKDTSAPSVAITSPPPGSFSSGTVVVFGTCETGTTVSVGGPGSASTTPAPCAGATFSVPVTLTAGDGLKTVTATQTDLAGNSGSASRGFNRDGTPPSVTFATPGPQFGGQNAPLTFSMADAGSGPLSLTIEFAGDGVSYGAPVGLSTSATAFAFPMPMINSASANFRLVATDALGNTQTAIRGPIPVMTVLARQPIAAAWNSYFRAASPGLACTGTETGPGKPCIHGGDKLMVLAGNKTSCLNLTATDQLGAFDWKCEMIDGSAHFTSRFKPDKGLRDLLNSAPAWTLNRVSILESGSPIHSTPLATWWPNPVAPLPSSSGAVQTLSGAGTIFVASSVMTTRGYNINADGIGLVTLPGTKLAAVSDALTLNCNKASGEIASPNESCLIAAGAQRFLWIEAELDGAGNVDTSGGGSGSNTGLLLSSVKFSAVQYSSFQNMGKESLLLKSSQLNRVQRIRVSNSDRALTVDSSSDNTFSGYVISNGRSGGPLVALLAPATGNALSGFLIHNGDFDAFSLREVAGSYAGNSFTMMTIANLGNMAMDIYGMQDSFIHNTLLATNGFGGGGDGLGLGSATQTVTGNTFSQLAISHSNQLIALYGSGVSGNKFTGNLVLGAFAGAECFDDTGSGNGGITASCGPTGASDFSRHSAAPIAGAVMGRVTSPDGNNLSNDSGQKSFESITDWLNFLNPFRGWGIEGAFPAGSSPGSCSDGMGCRIWDWRLKLSDTLFRNTSGDGTTQNAPFAAGAPCPSQANGNAILSNGSSSIVYLKSAVEFLGDDVGNDNGLCETGESCLYTPNFGAYQGEGALGKCTFVNGIVTDVTMLGYLSNGG